MKPVDGDKIKAFLKKRTKGLVIEESAYCVRALHKIISDLNKGIHKGEFDISDDEIKEAYRNLTGTRPAVLYAKQEQEKQA